MRDRAANQQDVKFHSGASLWAETKQSHSSVTRQVRTALWKIGSGSVRVLVHHAKARLRWTCSRTALWALPDSAPPCAK